MPTYTALVIDDEQPARMRLRRLLSKHPDIIKVIGEAADGFDALQKINNLRPDVIFLDIQMPGLNGFQLLEKAEHIPVVIFTTAYDQYALKAFETNSVDYLLKPVEPERLQQALSKLECLRGGPEREQILKILEMAQSQKPQEITSLPVKTGDTIHLVRTAGIAFLEANEKYVTIHTADGKEYLTDVSLKALEEKLPGNFMRVHRSYIVNKKMILEFHKYFQGRFVILLNDKPRTKITSGSGYLDLIRSSLEQL